MPSPQALERDHRPGRYGPTALLCTLLRCAGVELSEACCFALSGGAGFLYRVRPRGIPPHYVHGRRVELEETFFQNLDRPFSWRSASAFPQEELAARFAREEGILVLVDAAELPYRPGGYHFNGYPLLLLGWGREGRTIRALDGGREGVQELALETLRWAMNSAFPDPRSGTNLWAPLPDLDGLTEETVWRGVLRGLRTMGRNFLNLEDPEQGLAALRRWGQEVSSWPAQSANWLWSLRYGIHNLGEDGADGRAFRSLLADALMEVGERFPVVTQSSLPQQARRMGELWVEVIEALKGVLEEGTERIQDAARLLRILAREEEGFFRILLTLVGERRGDTGVLLEQGREER